MSWSSTQCRPPGSGSCSGIAARNAAKWSTATTGTNVRGVPGSTGSLPFHRSRTSSARPMYWPVSPVVEWPITLLGFTTVNGTPASAATTRTAASDSTLDPS